MARIYGFQPNGSGSIPGMGNLFAFIDNKLPFLKHVGIFKSYFVTMQPRVEKNVLAICLDSIFYAAERCNIQFNKIHLQQELHLFCLLISL